MGYRRAPSAASGIDAGRKPLHTGLVSYVRHCPATLRQPRPRPQRTSCTLPPNPVSLQASWKCSRPIRFGRIAVQPISSNNPGSGRDADLRTPRPRGLDPAHPSHLSRDSDRSRQGERYEAIVRAHGPEILENLNTPNWPEVMSSTARRRECYMQTGPGAVRPCGHSSIRAAGTHMIDNPIRILQKQTWWRFIYQPGSRSPPPGASPPLQSHLAASP